MNKKILFFLNKNQVKPFILLGFTLFFILCICCNNPQNAAFRENPNGASTEAVANEKAPYVTQGDEILLKAAQWNDAAAQNNAMFLTMLKQTTGVEKCSYDESTQTFKIPINDENRAEVSAKIDLLLASPKNTVDVSKVAEATEPKTDENLPFAAQFPREIEKISIAGIAYNDLLKYFKYEELVPYAAIESDDELKEKLIIEYKKRVNKK
jgi:hypothetical protein